VPIRWRYNKQPCEDARNETASIEAGRRAPTEAFALVISDVVSIGGVKLKPATSQLTLIPFQAC
jgi:hypothetical protein